MRRNNRLSLLILVGGVLTAFATGILLSGSFKIQVTWALPRSPSSQVGLSRPRLTPTVAASPFPTITASQTEIGLAGSEGTPSATSIPFLYDSAENKELFGGSGMVAFVSDRDGNPEIYALELATGEMRRLTYSDMADFHPRWSPDGRWIAFTSYRDGGPDIHIITSTGALRHSLTDAQWFDEFPSWSLDGEWIMFDSNQLTEGTTAGEDIFRLYLMRRDGTDLQLVLPDSTNGAVGSFSPDGKRVVFQSRVGEGEYQIFTYDLESRLIVRLTHTLARNFRPSWSPDSSQIVFVSERDGQAELYIMEADGTNQRRLTDGSLEHVRGPVWSPDGEWILFNAEADNNTDLYVIDRNGNRLFRLTDHPSDDYHPDWRPHGP